MEYNKMRELNVKEIEQVNGGWGWLRYLRPTKMGNGEMPSYWDTGDSCSIVPVEGATPVYP
ncbi:hypothetical protein [Pseudoalteromonas sp. SG45-2]|jgi:hypothetical protein|nr:hypothetical protein [Pseudoalteromonas sp. SG45-2]MBB1345844.1 hypothetical protein [Pseudoalteromonas sp. SG45-2]|tara:strand:+ start:236 stop:418 length:183 start_codon:yes stop_codon:yes gene_type:complete